MNPLYIEFLQIWYNGFFFSLVPSNDFKIVELLIFFMITCKFASARNNIVAVPLRVFKGIEHKQHMCIIYDQDSIQGYNNLT